MERFSSKAYLEMELFRFTTAGSVDDGKSTLIGRLLYDSKSIFEDQLDAIRRASLRKGGDHLNLALLTDGLRAEREQGITIDVAYRYFATPKRKFIIADTPGHIQYTRNMVTGASTANAALILIDARNGVTEQTFRHSYLAYLLGIPHIIICVNKMDLVDYREEVFRQIRHDFNEFAGKVFPGEDLRFIPISALHGDNIVSDSSNMPWYSGGTLLNVLETIPIDHDYNYLHKRFPVQYVIRPESNEYHDYRGYAGKIASGIFRPGDSVITLPSRQISRIATINTFTGSLDLAYPPLSVSLVLEDDIDITRGDLIVDPEHIPAEKDRFDAMICWMNPRPMTMNGKYLMLHMNRFIKCITKEVTYVLNISTADRVYNSGKVSMNDIACVSLKTTNPVYADSYLTNRMTGNFILIDESSFETVAAGMIL